LATGRPPSYPLSGANARREVAGWLREQIARVAGRAMELPIFRKSEGLATTQEYPTLVRVYRVHLQVVAVRGVIGGRVAILSLALMTGVRP
jgi:hypothetical protein